MYPCIEYYFMERVEFKSAIQDILKNLFIEYTSYLDKSNVIVKVCDTFDE